MENLVEDLKEVKIKKDNMSTRSESLKRSHKEHPDLWAAANRKSSETKRSERFLKKASPSIEKNTKPSMKSANTTRKAIYPGSFNPWHAGHQDILDKASKVFDQVDVVTYGKDFRGLLSEYLKGKDYIAIVRGLRNGYDLQYEQNNQYWYEDMGITIPVVYFITDRKLGHISSSAIRAVEDARNGVIKEKD